MADDKKIAHILKHHGPAAAAIAEERARAAEINNIPTVGDRYGRRLMPGDFVAHRANLDVYCEVLDIAPVLDPRAKPGTVLVTLGATFELPMQRNTTNVYLTQIVTAAQRAAADKLDADTDNGPGDAPAAPAAPAGPAIVLTDVERPEAPPEPEAPPAEAPAAAPDAPKDDTDGIF